MGESGNDHGLEVGKDSVEGLRALGRSVWQLAPHIARRRARHHGTLVDPCPVFRDPVHELMTTAPEFVGGHDPA